jgi:hypothetical protein
MNQDIRDLTGAEIDAVTGGAFFVPLIPIAVAAFGAGYVYGRDRAKRDNANDENQSQEQNCTG